MWPEDINDKLAHIAMWSEGGLNTLVKVLPADQEPDPGKRLGLCTMIGHLVDRTAFDLQTLIGMHDRVNLSAGAVIYVVRPLPGEAQFLALSIGTKPKDMPESAAVVTLAGEGPASTTIEEEDDFAFATDTQADLPGDLQVADPEPEEFLPDVPAKPRSFDIPRWSITGLTQASLRPVAQIGPGLPFFYDARLVAAVF